ncbi:hypothetical protein [Crassaminicella profunda]|uniref:hypothetical protein n=1 Tax=Crassaminicella profunda TaxID=1286698 RepID=UPI001CA77E4E|nr:hypothetical protein [Crassaminicella profunda]QZY54930.1 hypothetical protein K7H06_18215 [Crassaminicella profunda]
MKNIGKIHIDKDKVLKFLGYGQRKPPQIIQKKLNEECEGVYPFIKPQIHTKIFKIIHKDNHQITLENNYVLKGEYAFNQLKICERVCVALYTIGKEMDHKIKYYANNNEMMRGMILDKIGVVALDDIKEGIKLKLLKEVAPLKISSEIYPGEKDFSIFNQRIIFDLLKDENMHICINEEYQFFPIKTVGVIFGLGRKAHNRDLCESCENKCF